MQNVTNQLVSPLAISSSSPKTDDKSSLHSSPSQGMETWRRLSVDVVTLTQWNANLRMVLMGKPFFQLKLMFIPILVAVSDDPSKAD